MLRNPTRREQELVVAVPAFVNASGCGPTNRRLTAWPT